MDIKEWEEYARMEIERQFHSVDPTDHKVAWFEEEGRRHTFITFAVKSKISFEDAVWGLIRGIRYDCQKEQGQPMVWENKGDDYRMAWRMFPKLDTDEDDGGYIAICRLAYWPEKVPVDPFKQVAA